MEEGRKRERESLACPQTSGLYGPSVVLSCVQDILRKRGSSKAMKTDVCGLREKLNGSKGLESLL